MKKLFLIITLAILSIITLNAQKVTGIITDTNGVLLAGVDITLYSFAKTVKTNSNYYGSFTLDLLTNVENNSLPEGYSISNNYPNPFNPKTRIDFTLPKASYIRAEIFNVAGQRVRDVIEANLSAGSNHLDLELNGLPNGFYFARIVIDGSYTVTKKLMLLYGSQHLNAAGNITSTKIGKTKKDIFIDSIVISADFLERTKITPPSYTAGNTLDIGKIKVKKLPEPYTPCPSIPTVTYEGKTYNTVLIGTQCWLKENLDVGMMIKGTENQTNNNIIEKYCYKNDSANCTAYGGLYQWGEAMQSLTTEKVRGICPQGWHIPSHGDFDTLKRIVSGNGNKLKCIGQGLLHYLGDGIGTNESGFSALLAGYRYTYDGFSKVLGQGTYFWGSTADGISGGAYGMSLFYYEGGVHLSSYGKADGYSVRCLKD
jgi:uncharacterized protein (TIGR02145 family)